ncbi:MAG: type I 3-dehydroquinate dehydratase [Dehalococcoidales bacterium]|nr:type I 3-dehydroquinate dehydratase [Dehalococcoidales bacterium]
MNKSAICAVVIANDLQLIKEVAPLADLFELRIDLIGEGWQDLTRKLGKPWIATNRTAVEGGQWQGPEARRIEPLLHAVELGASFIDVEVNTPNLENIARAIKRRTKLLLSYHDLEKTPSLDDLKRIVRKQLNAGADICKVVSTASEPEDNLTVLKLIKEFPEAKIVAFAMGPLGILSRVLCPLAGGEFTYASISKGKESAKGQLTVGEMRNIYEMMGV